MAATATFYLYNKRSNSTAVPSSGGTAVDVLLKEGTSLLNPVLLLHLDTVPNWSMCNFMARWYFVTDVISVRNGQWEIYLSVDVLGTWKAAIQATEAFVEYAAVSNYQIVDGRLPTKTDATYAENNVIVNENASWAGSYICGVSGVSSVNCFRIPNLAWLSNILANAYNNWIPSVLPNLDQSPYYQATNVMEALLNLCWYFKELGKQLIGSGNNLSDNIRFVRWVPWQIGTTRTEAFNLGMYNTGVVASLIDTFLYRSSFQVAIPWQAADWRRNEPYHYIYLYLPFVGVVNIAASQIIGQTVIDGELCFNQISGEIAYKVRSGDNIIGMYSANTAVDLPFGGSAVSAAQKIASFGGAASGVAAAVASGSVIGGAAAVASLASIRPTTGGGGGGGGSAVAGLDLNVRCFSIFHDIVALPSNPATTIGEPYMRAVLLSTMAGYLKTIGASVTGGMTETERQQINALLDSGIYLV